MILKDFLETKMGIGEGGFIKVCYDIGEEVSHEPVADVPLFIVGTDLSKIQFEDVKQNNDLLKLLDVLERKIENIDFVNVVHGIGMYIFISRQ